LLKIAADLSQEERRDIAEVACAAGIDGLVVANATVARDDSAI
jgi:dihydroorotate dehydrogenase